MSETRPGWWSRNWKWAVPVIVLCTFGSCAGCILVAVNAASGVLKSPQVYGEALNTARTDERVKAALGEPIQDGFLPSGEVHVMNDSGDAKLAVPLHGPRGDATLHLDAKKEAGRWNFNTLVVELANGERLDLLTKGGP